MHAFMNLDFKFDFFFETHVDLHLVPEGCCTARGKVLRLNDCVPKAQQNCRSWTSAGC